MTLALRSRYVAVPLILGLITLTLLTLRFANKDPLQSIIRHSHAPSQPQPPPPPDPPELKHHPLYKSAKSDPIPPPLPEYFPLAATAKSSADLPPVPSWNKPPEPHVPESTRLYIGFTRYWPLLQQVVVSYITAGWPPEDIYVVENTGTFDANKHGLLTSQNPFYLDYHRLTDIFGVNVITMPSLQSFAQLQNFYLSEAVNNNLTHYFWAHMDTVAVSHEDTKPYKSLYSIAVDTIRESFAPGFRRDKKTGKEGRWGIRFFAYDWLALVNVASYVEVGGWDTMISYYGTDCDMHERLGMAGLVNPIADAGMVYDVGKSLPDLEVLYRRKKKTTIAKREEKTTGSTFDEGPRVIKTGDDGVREVLGDKTEEKTTGSTFDDGKKVVTIGKDNKITIVEDANSAAENDANNTTDSDHPPIAPIPSDTPQTTTATPAPVSAAIKSYLSSTTEDTLSSPHYHNLLSTLEALAKEKREDPYRNSWQLQQRGGQGEPFHYNPDGWEKALQMTIEAGGKIMEEKWGHRGCDLRKVGLRQGDQWRVERDW